MSPCNSAIVEFCERIAFRALSPALAWTLLFAAQNRVEAQGAALNQRVLIVSNSADANSTGVAKHPDYAATQPEGNV